MSAITTHVLDTSLGRPAVGVPVRLVAVGSDGADAIQLGAGTTDSDGRVTTLGPVRVEVGTYRLVFDTAAYFSATGQRGFFPEVTLTFDVEDPEQHFHVPVLLSPFAYSTYRGS